MTSPQRWSLRSSSSRFSFPTINPSTCLRLEILEDRITPAVHAWTGLGANNLWSNPQNWTNGSPSSDLSGNIDLVFHSNLVNQVQHITQNDLTGLIVDSITFDAVVGMIGLNTFANGGPTTTGYTINGNTLTINTTGAGENPFGIDIAVGLAGGPGVTQTFNVDLALVGSDATFRSQETLARLTLNGDLDLGSQTLTVQNTAGATNDASIEGVVISGVVSNGNLLKDGTGTLQLTGNNTYADTTVNSGVVRVESDTGLGAAGGTVTVNGQSSGAAGQVQLRNGITVIKTTLEINSNANGGGLSADGNTTNTWKGAVNLTADTVSTSTAIGSGNGDANAATRLIVDGVISGASGTLFINGAGVVEFTQNNTYAGTTILNGVQGFGAIQIDAPGGLGAGGVGNETRLNRDGAGPTGASLFLNFNGTLEDASFNGEIIEYAGAGVDSLGAVRTLGNSNVILTGDVIFIAGAPWFFGVDGPLGSLTTTGVIDSQGANRALTKVGAGTMVIAGTNPNTYLVGTNINGGVVSVQNTSANPLGPDANVVNINETGTLHVAADIVVPNAVNVNAGGTLTGEGTIANTVTSTGGTISPGSSAGILTLIGDLILDADSTFKAEINGTTPGTDFDQVDVTGTVNLGNAVLRVNLGFGPTSGAGFVLIENDGTDLIVGTFAGLPEGSKVEFNGTAFLISYEGGDGNDVELTALFPVTKQFAAGQGPGGTSLVRGFNLDGSERANLAAFPPTFQGGVRVATGDVNNDGFDDIIVGSGPGFAPRIQVFSGQDNSLLKTFFAFGSTFQGGVFVASGDINNDGFNDIIVGAGSRGLPVVRIFSGLDDTPLAMIMVFGSTFRGGVRVGSGDINRDGFDDIITGAGVGGNPVVKVFSGVDGSVLRSFLAYDTTFLGGVYVAGGDVNNDGFSDIIVGAGAGLPPVVRIFNGTDNAPLSSFFAFGPGFLGGITVGSEDVNQDGFADIIVGAGSGGNPVVRVIDGQNNTQLDSFFAFDAGFKGGVFVGG